MSEPGMNDAPTDNDNPSDSSLPPSPGARLAAYREERGWTVEQVAKQLNLAPRQVTAIESDDYASLPGMPIVRGFVRAYAKLLKVDCAPLLATLGGETVLAPEQLVPRKTLSTPFSEARLPSMADRPAFSSKWIVGVLLVILLGVAIWAAQQSEDVTNLQKSAASQVKEGLGYLSGAGSKPQNSTPAKPQEAKPPVEVTPAAPAVSQAADLNAPSVKPAESVAAAPATQPQAVAPAVPPTTAAAEVAAPPAKDVLVLKAREESWVEVRRAANMRSMLSRLMKPGETETLEITEPVSLVIGNAAGVDVTLRGDPLDIKAGNSNVARLNLK